MAKFNILNKAEKVLDYVINITDKAPKHLRADLIPRMRDRLFDIYEAIIRANGTWDKEPTKELLEARLKFQNQTLINIQILEGYLELCKHSNYITNDQFEYSTKLCSELFIMIKNWQNADLDRFSKLGV